MFWNALDKLKEIATQAAPALAKLYELLQQTSP